ncbi:hypothetical protein ElyMa_005717100 [Elysia marginata]|uniref:Ig-like domain-containing protein n=1 Tax=Elysia marginata TaxID=1093978 RepID=A0AAV4FHF8_9GAST|nr:hypothetical protein ElyMa_005717100 [Elysia marginata]
MENARCVRMKLNTQSFRNFSDPKMTCNIIALGHRYEKADITLLVEPSCGPIEEGQSTTLTCDVNTAGCSGSFVATWRIEERGSFDIAACGSDSCGGRYSSDFPTTISSTRTTLTISNVSRVTPFNMETKWACHSCDRGHSIVCDKLQVYATIMEFPSKHLFNKTTRLCIYYRDFTVRTSTYRGTGGNNGKITRTPVYNNTVIPATATTPVYYRSQCTVSVSVKKLGEGTHSFQGYIYPDVTGGENLVRGSPTHKTVTLSFPQVSQSCLTNREQGYFIGKSARCTCRVTSDGYPRGWAQWYMKHKTVGTKGDLVITYKKNIIDSDSVQIASASSKVNLCNNNNQVQVTCKISRDHVNPAPTFSFSVDGPRSQGPQPVTGSNRGNHYHSQFSLSPDVGGQYQVTCRVTNTVTNTWHDKSIQITFKKPPPAPPVVTIAGLTVQGNPDPTSVTLSRERTKEVLATVQATELTHTLGPLDCLDTGVYVCSGQNAQGTTLKEISVGVRCPQRFTANFNPPLHVDVVVGKKAEIDIDLQIYGLPEPSRMVLRKTKSDIALTSSPRHKVKYTAGISPYGNVNVIFYDLAETDLTNYTLTIDNGVGEALTYLFDLNQVDLNLQEETENDIFKTIAIIIGVVAGIVFAVSVVIIAFVVKKMQNLNERLLPACKAETVYAISSMSSNRQCENARGMSANTHAKLMSASQPPGNTQYENIPDIDQHTGPNSSTSLQDVEPPNIYSRAKSDSCF